MKAHNNFNITRVFFDENLTGLSVTASIGGGLSTRGFGHSCTIGGGVEAQPLKNKKQKSTFFI